MAYQQIVIGCFYVNSIMLGLVFYIVIPCFLVISKEINSGTLIFFLIISIIFKFSKIVSPKANPAITA